MVIQLSGGQRLNQTIRVEHKFIINKFKYQHLLQKINFYFKPDPYTPQNYSYYPVFTRYYDTMSHLFLEQKTAGHFEHIKVRIRTYSNFLKNFNSNNFIETKIKRSDTTLKSRAIFKDDIMKPITTANTKLNISNILYRLRPQTSLYPACHIFYKRIAYLGNFENERIRINFDFDLYALPTNIFKLAPTTIPYTKPIEENIIFEIKTSSSRLPDQLLDIMQDIGIEKVSCSKYELCMNSLSNNNF